VLAETFSNAIKAAFFPLAEEHGLKPGETLIGDHGLVRITFLGERVVLTVTYDRGEIDATFMQPEETRPEETREGEYPLRYVLAAAGVRDGRTRWPRIVSGDTVDRSVADLLEDLEVHARPWLDGNEDAYARVAEYRSTETALQTSQFGPGRRPGDLWRPIRGAWEAQEFDALIGLLEALPTPLRDAEEQALQYSRRYRDPV
jgi:hypothetical protein